MNRPTYPTPLARRPVPRRVAALGLGRAVVLAGCGGSSVFDAAAATSSTTLLQAASTAAATPLTGVVLYDVSDLVAQVRPGVVSVTEAGTAMGLFRRRVQARGEGTGIVIDGEGHILTNYHVISGAETVSVYAEDGRERSARVIFGDPATDIALLEIEDGEGLVPLVLGDSGTWRWGTP